MEAKYDTIKVPATPDYILSVIQDLYRFSCENDCEAEPDMDLSFDSTIDDWRMACDLLSWRGLGAGLNDWFCINFDSSQWHSLLEPASKKTLRELCEAIAEKTDRETIKPMTIFGQKCLKGGVFLTIRSKLAEAGADVSELSPSSLLDDYLCSYFETFYKISSQLFPNTLPVMKINRVLTKFSIYGFLLSGGLILLSTLADALNFELLTVLFIIFGVSLLFFFFLLLLISSRLKPDSVDFGGLKTFRDMVNCIVDGDTQ